MNNKSQYNTRQHDEVLEYLKSVRGQHVTAAEVYEHLAGVGSAADNEVATNADNVADDRVQASSGRKIGKATVYRQLERLVEEGFVDKYIIDQNTPACFEYIDNEECGDEFCVHGKCLKCGKLFHLHCDEIKTMQHHLIEHHGFVPDFHHTVIYGLCADCAGSQSCARSQSCAGSEGCHE